MRNPKFRLAGYLKAELVPCLLLALSLALSQKTLFAQAGQLSPNRFAVSHSVVVVGSNGPSFDSLLDRDFPGASQVEYFQTVKPLLAIVVNNSERVVKAFVIKWTITSPTGATSTATLPVIWYPPPGDPDLPGSVTVLGRGGTGLGTELVSPYSHWTEQRFPVLLKGNAVGAVFQYASLRSLTSAAQGAASVQATLDGAIFGDGVCVGPNTSKLFERFQAVQKSRVDEAKWMLSELKSGLTNQQLRDALSEQIFKGRDATGTDSASLYAAARGVAASRLMSLLNSGGPPTPEEFSLGWAAARPVALRRQAGQ